MSESMNVLTPWRPIVDYHRCMKVMINAWDHFFKNEFHSEYLDHEEITTWLKKLSTTLDLIRDMHLYDTARAMRVYPVASGFPDRLHVQIVASEKKRLQNEEITADPKRIKRAFLDHLFTHKRCNNWMLEQLAKSVANERLKAERLLSLFSLNRVQRLERKDGRPAFACCFERYCYRHIPSLYVLIFEYTGVSELNSELPLLLQIMEEDTSNMPLLEHFAKKVDQAIATIHPKWVGRLSLGPVFISNLTQDEHLLQQSLDRLTKPGEYQAASRVIYEHIISSGETPVDRLYDSQGHKHEFVQNFMIREMDAECMLRRVSGVEKHLFAPHHVIQILDSDFKNSIGHQFVPLEV